MPETLLLNCVIDGGAYDPSEAGADQMAQWVMEYFYPYWPASLEDLPELL